MLPRGGRFGRLHKGREYRRQEPDRHRLKVRLVPAGRDAFDFASDVLLPLPQSRPELAGLPLLARR